jgi:hypothetical protein
MRLEPILSQKAEKREPKLSPAALRASLPVAPRQKTAFEFLDFPAVPYFSK